MLGPDFLVAPVLQKGAQSRSVYLPPLPKVRIARGQHITYLADPPPRSTKWTRVQQVASCGPPLTLDLSRGVGAGLTLRLNP